MGIAREYAGRDGVMAVALVPPSMDFTIRPFAEADRAAIKALWLIAFTEFPDDPDANIDFCLRSGHGALFVGCLNGEVIGTILAGHDGHRGWIYHLATHPDRRGRGYARRLVAHAEAFLAGLGVPKVNLQIRAHNGAVQDFYERLGYAVEPRIQMGKRFSVTPPLRLAEAERDGKLEITITYLEMLHRPRLPAPPPPALKLAVLRADAVSVPFYRYLYDTVGAPWLWYERRGMSDADLAAAIQHPDVDVFVLFADGEPAGYAELDRRGGPDIELAYFGLVPAFIGRKLGPWLLHWAIDAAWTREPGRLWVHTCSLDHPKAIAHYQRAGFVPYRQEKKIIADPRPLL
jgi:ribosomal protein S18 acetylase RimI-like enzyme